MATYSSFENKLNDNANKKIEKEKILIDLQKTTLPDCNHFFDLVLKRMKDKREMIKNRIRIKFKEFLNLTNVILNNLNIQPHLIETATIFTIYTFYESILIDRHEEVNEQTLNRLERVFDRSQLNKKVVNQAFDLSKELFDLVDEESIHYFFQDNLIRKSKVDKNSFIDYKPTNYDASSADCKITNYLNFNMQTIETTENEQAAAVDPNERPAGRTIEWLEEELKKVLNEQTELCFSLEELVNIIYEKFQEPKYSDDVLQNDLLNLLGLNQIELIGEIIQNRKSILWSIRERICGVVSSSNSTNKSKPKTKPLYFKEPKAPSFTQTMLIQTEQELKEQKLLNKLERKMYQERKRLKGPNDESSSSKGGNNLMSNYESILNDNSEFSFYLKRLENERIPKEDLPYVFDLYSDIKHTTSFISNQKLLLPEGTEMKDHKSHKEIIVPPPEKPKKEILENYPLIPIEQLDKISQKIFAGFKHLNQIQSVVYETASKTNENLLISSPTGSGKTNIALLTMIHEIKKNVCPETGKIDKDAFKIIYVTPMKALASECTENFSKKLTKSVGLSVRELTGDMQLTHEEIKKTNVLVMTPEKLDILSRKVKENSQLIELIKLLIFDEVHLLQTDRGAVIESIVSRIVRHVESAQKMIRLVGLSATLPNYLDVAEFLRVNTKNGLFFFDSRFRPVPLIQTFIGCKSVNKIQVQKDMDEICFDKVNRQVLKGNQCMVFVHTRHNTLKTATYLKDETVKSGLIEQFMPRIDIYQKKLIESARNNQLRDLIFLGFGIHHAGLLRHDRNLVEKLFKEGVIKVLVTTATLAWGVNLPVHAVIIKGTEMYDPQKGGFVDLDFLDVIQCFGRAGRPQFDTLGEATIITTHDKLKHYLSILTNQLPIESQFLNHLTDNLNAEIASGTVTTIEEGVDWLSYTYLFVRIQKNGRNYGITAANLQNDPDLYHKRVEYIKGSVEKLDKAKMIRYDPVSQTLDPTDLGRTASHFYIKCETIEAFNQYLNDVLLEDDVLKMVCLATEFSQLKSREEELDELIDIKRNHCMLKVALTPDHVESKVNILIQAFLSRARVNSFSLISDTFFIQQNVKRICRGLFEYSIRKGMPLLSRKLLTFSKMFELEQWDFETPFRQFKKQIDPMEIEKLERLKLPLFKIRSPEYDYKELARLLRCPDNHAIKIKKLANCLPLLSIDTEFRPITRSVMQVILKITAEFDWNDQFHGKVSEMFWLWLEDDSSNHIYHYEKFKITRKQVMKKELQTLTFTIPLLDPDNIPTHYIVHYDSDRWIACGNDVVINCENLKLPEKFLPFTKLLDLYPLPITVLNNELYQSVYKFTHFNPIQTQVFHTLYHTDQNCLIGCPTGSGKTICSEIACFRVFNEHPTGKVIYIGPLKALVRERVVDWRKRLENKLGKRIVELTGDTGTDSRTIRQSDIIVTTPEKYDGISRSWNTRKYVQDVSLIIIDEIHLLGLERGNVLEAIVSRTNFINRHTGKKIRIIGLSTAIANAQDIAHWLEIEKIGLYNFRPSVRPVPIEVHIAGYSGNAYCPRMMLMNKPTYRAILQHSPNKPVLVFVSSRRQTRLTALDLIAFAAQDNPKQWIRISDEEINSIVNHMVKDSNLKLTLSFGVGIHHSGLTEQDRSLVEEMFANNKIQILISTSTLAWGVNLPAHLVVIKGTEYYDGKTHKYVDFPITDVLQMIGRAGRIQFDTFGKAVVLVQDIKKEYYKKFLYEPFPVESNLLPVFPSHLNAEVVAGTIKTKSDCIQYLSWTFLFRRLLKNPSYYGLPDAELPTISNFLTTLVDVAVEELMDCYCIDLEDDNRTLVSLPLGQITSFYYLHHKTVKMFVEKLNNNNQDFENLLWILTRALEFSELPVRHNEDILNKELNESCRYRVKDESFDSSHTKTFILLQAHFSRFELPCSDYLTDLKSVMDQCIRVLQAMIDIVSMKGLSLVCVRLIIILQMIIQGRWFDDETVLIISNIEKDDLFVFYERNLPTFLPQLISVVEMKSDIIDQPLMQLAKKSPSEIKTIVNALGNYPLIELNANLLDAETNKEVVDNFVLHTPCESKNSISLSCDKEYVLEINLRKIKTRINAEQRQRAIAPKFNKVKDENWFLILEERSTNELIAMKRCSNIQMNRKHLDRLVFTCPNQPGKYVYTLYYLSDAYLGLDQQYEFCFEAV